MAYFAIRWLAETPRHAVLVLALQVGAAAAQRLFSILTCE